MFVGTLIVVIAAIFGLLIWMAIGVVRAMNRNDN